MTTPFLSKTLTKERATELWLALSKGSGSAIAAMEEAMTEREMIAGVDALWYAVCRVMLDVVVCLVLGLFYPLSLLAVWCGIEIVRRAVMGMIRLAKRDG